MFNSSVETTGFSAVGQDELEQVNGGIEPITTVLVVAGFFAGFVTGAAVASK